MPEPTKAQRAWAWLKAHWYLPFALLFAVLGFVLLAISGSSGEHSNLALRVEDELRRSKEKKDAELDRIRQDTDAKVREVEAIHEDAIARLEADSRAEYDSVRKKGPRAVAKWLNDFDKTF